MSADHNWSAATTRNKLKEVCSTRVVNIITTRSRLAPVFRLARLGTCVVCHLSRRSSANTLMGRMDMQAADHSDPCLRANLAANHQTARPAPDL